MSIPGPSSLSFPSNSSIPSSSTYGSKNGERKRINAITSTKEEIIGTAKNALHSLTNVARREQEVDEVGRWVLYLESELRRIKDEKLIRRIQRQIIELVLDANKD